MGAGGLGFVRGGGDHGRDAALACAFEERLVDCACAVFGDVAADKG